MMQTKQIIELGFQHIADAVFARWPRTIPPADRFRQCKLVAHRGDFRKSSLQENTLDAFQATADAGVWGIELDIRWTQDMVPVVAHDPDLHRLFGDRKSITALSFKSLRNRFAMIASLEEVVALFGGRIHFMIEIKQQSWPELDRQSRMLDTVLSALDPVKDYHILSMHHQTLDGLSFAPPQAKAVIAYHWPAGQSQLVIDKQWGGLCGHYLLMKRDIMRRHKQTGQKIGTGFVDSPNCLCREIERGVDWIFSNKAAELQEWINWKTTS